MLFDTSFQMCFFGFTALAVIVTLGFFIQFFQLFLFLLKLVFLLFIVLFYFLELFPGVGYFIFQFLAFFPKSIKFPAGIIAPITVFPLCRNIVV